jgi:hypothetical protein
MSQRDQTPDLLICQPAVAVTGMLDLALGVQNLWADELSECGLWVIPSLLKTQRPGIGAIPICHRRPYGLDMVESLYGHVQGLPRHALQSQLFLMDARPSHARARMGRLGERGAYASDLQIDGGYGAVLGWIFDVVDDVCLRLHAEAPAHRWQDRLETTDATEALVWLAVRGAMIRETLDITAAPVWDDEGRKEWALMN